MVEEQDKDAWEHCEEEHKKEFIDTMRKFQTDLNEAIGSLQGEIELEKYDRKYEAEVKQNRLSSNEMITHFEELMERWLMEIHKYIEQTNSRKGEGRDPGPKTELEHWRNRQTKLTTIIEQMRSKDCKVVFETLMQATKNAALQKPKDSIISLIQKWKNNDIQLTEALNEAKDNVKYLRTLENFIEPLYIGNPQSIIDSLQALMTSIKMIHTIARYYNNSENMTGLFQKITNQMITNCRNNITKGSREHEKLWNSKEFPPAKLVAVMRSCIELRQAYKNTYQETKQKLKVNDKGKQFEFSESKIFGKLDLFCRRVGKLIELFEKIEQFETLTAHNFEGIEEILAKFRNEVDKLKNKKHDLLDYSQSAFDRDFVEFNVEVSNIETTLQQFINKNFEIMNNIENSIKFLSKFQSMLKSETLREDLNKKYTDLFNQYGANLSEIQSKYSKAPTPPPMVRNLPNVPGTITWTRHLYERIYKPLKLFQRACPKLLKEPESKKHLKTYNKLAECLITWEIRLLNSWAKVIDRAKGGLQATLIVPNPQKLEELCVNYDDELKALVREAKVLSRMGIEVKESAKIVLLQEEKFKTYYDELNYLIKEYYRIITKIRTNSKRLLVPHIEDLEFKLKPGMVTLTWTSMNIDTYLTQVHGGLCKLEQLIININDIMDNRIEKNLKKLSKTPLVDLPAESKPFALDFFVEMQETFITSKADFLKSKNIEVESAVEDLIKVIVDYPRDSHTKPISSDEIQKLIKYYNWSMYQALLHATKASLNALKERVCGRATSDAHKLKPFFEVEVTLEGTEAKLNPPLTAIQTAINKAANAVLKSTKHVENWNQKDIPEDKREPFYDWIARDKEIVKVILLLTGSIQGTKNKVKSFLDVFQQYEWLWRKDIETSLEEWSAKNPSLEEYEEELKIFHDLDDKIGRIEAVTVIGAMALKTDDFKDAIINWVKQWKKAYARDLQVKAQVQLESLGDEIKQYSIRLKKEVKDIDSLGEVMNTLLDIRNLESEIEMRLKPVNEIYDLLDTYLKNIQDVQGEDRETLLRSWEKLVKDAEITRNELQIRQTEFKKTLILGIRTLIDDVKEFRKDFEVNGPMVPGLPPREALDRLKRFSDEYMVRKRKYDISNQGETLFNLTHKSYPELDKTNQEITLLKKLYNLYQEVLETIGRWKDLGWSEMNNEIKGMTEQIDQYAVSCTRLPRKLKEWDAYTELREEIEKFQKVLPLVAEMSKSSIRDRHWAELMQTCGKTINYQADNFTLAMLMEIDVLEYTETIEDIGDSADKQLKIEIQLRDDINYYWEFAEFEIMTWKTRDQPCVLSGFRVQEIQEKIEEHMMALNTMNAMRHVTPFRAEVTEKLSSYSEVNDIIEKWLRVQTLWTSLESVFRGGDIAKQMPMEAKKFMDIDKKWLKIMGRAHEQKNVIQCCSDDMLKNFLSGLQDGLEVCQRKLDSYLEAKKKKFARFYFVSDSELLKILSQGSDPTAVQDDFEKLFDAITKVNFDKKERRNIVSIQTNMGQDLEVIQLVEPVKCEGNIEDWLKSLENEMVRSMRYISREIEKGARGGDIKAFINEYCSQMALAGIQILWTSQVENAIMETQQGKNKKIAEQTKEEILDLMKVLSLMCLEKIDSKLKRIKVETLVVIHVHQRDVFTDQLMTRLVQKTLKDVGAFIWQQNTRFYWKADQDTIKIEITDVDFPYSYEYLGAKERLCITPLTDRCYITLAQALGMHYGGAPAGPAGTGKTETVKDMGRSMGIRVVVTNCSEQHRYRDMAKIFKGLCQSGLWGCFDEFNRIALEVLSVVAMQIESIASAKRLGRSKFDFPDEPEQIDNNLMAAYFITMNPGYAGRQELPENLKVLFRGVTMMVPDKGTIIKVKLASVGYENDIYLSKKFKILYQLCDEQLSKQQHYDWGLRNILSVLRTAGNTKRVNIGVKEEVLLKGTLRDMNLAKLVAEDIPLFEALLKDIFAIELKDKGSLYPEIEEASKDHAKKLSLVIEPKWLRKIIQLYEVTIVRHGVMVVGPTGSGKSMIIKCLTSALTDVKMIHKVVKLNPKSLTNEEMYGVCNEASGEWQTGVFSAMWEKSNKKTNKFATWIVCDGPVDARWIENLNTVLDDNKILTLANNERIPMSDTTRLVFEVQDLLNASPATVSRCGIIYVSSTDLGWKAPIECWEDKRILSKICVNSEEKSLMNGLIKKYVSDADLFIKLEKDFLQVMPTNEAIKVNNLLSLLTALLQPFEGASVVDSASFEKFFVYALIWSFGGLFESREREKFHKFLEEKGAPLPNISAAKRSEKETMYDYQLDDKFGGKNVGWKAWEPDKWEKPKKLSFSQLLIPTVDSTRSEFLIKMIHSLPLSENNAKSVLLLGGVGTAKTSTVLMYASKFDDQVMLLKRINFSSATTPHMFQDTIEGELDRRTGKTFEPPGGKHMTIFLDDLSMPFVNEWLDQETLEIVRQLIEMKGFYFLTKDQRGDFKTIQNLQYVGAMGHPVGGRNDIPNRAKRHFFAFNMVLPSQKSVDNIYGTILKTVFTAKKYPDVLKVVDAMTGATIEIWEKTSNTLLPTPAKFHYIFNLRELSRVFQGFLQVTLHPEHKVIQQASAIGKMKGDNFLVLLWRHECKRVFEDKLTNPKDKETFTDLLDKVTLERFKDIIGEEDDKLLRDIFFCDFLRDDVIDEETDEVIDVAPKVYEAIPNLKVLKEIVCKKLEEHNKIPKIKKMNLVLFEDALRYLLRITRIVQMPRGSCMNVGVGGSGKQSLTKLAAHISRHEHFQIQLSKSYGYNQLKDDLKMLYQKTGPEAKTVTFVLTDAEIKQEGFLEYISSFMSTGEVVGLIPKEEKDTFRMEIKNVMIKEGAIGKQEDPTKAEMWNYGINRVRDCLHIVLSFSPVGIRFRNRFQAFPALFNSCTINWFLPWPEEALVSVCSSFLSDFDIDSTAEVKGNLEKHMGNVHSMVTTMCDKYFQKRRRQVYVTPKSYLSFIEAYKNEYEKLFTIKNEEERNVRVGLTKLKEGAEGVEVLKINLKEENARLDEATQKTDEMVKNLEKEGIQANKKADEVKMVKEACEQDKAKITIEREEANKELAAALPFQMKAEEALKELHPKDIQEIKSYRNPKEIIRIVLDGVQILYMLPLIPMKVKEMAIGKDTFPFIHDSFDECTKLTLGNTNFLPDLMVFSEIDKDYINDETVEFLEPYLNLDKYFNAKVARSAGSKALGGLCIWVEAMRDYHNASKIVKPKMAALEIKSERLRVAEEELADAEAKLKDATDFLDSLKKSLKAQLDIKEQLKDNANKTKRKMEQANRLISGLGDERERWTKDALEFGKRKKQLVGDIALACSFISYCGPFNSEYRDILLNQFFKQDLGEKEIPYQNDLDIISMLSSEGDRGDWSLQGLPSDDLSIQNAIMVTKSKRFPLLIDPQGQAVKWIKSRESELESRNCLLSINNPNLKDLIKVPLGEGWTVLIEGIENDVDPLLDPILEQQTFKKGKSFMLKLGDTETDYDVNFKLFMTTKLANPLFSPELAAKTTIIDFTVTQTGLEQQLLGLVIAKEQRSLEEQLKLLMEDVTKNTKTMADLNQQLLDKLAANETSLLDDVELIDVLAQIKTKTREIQNKLKESAEKKKEISEKRLQYLPVATRGSVLYFCIVELVPVNWMYNTSLQQFLRLFDGAIDTAQKAQLPKKRVENIVDNLTLKVYNYISRGLFENHKVTFLMMICMKIMLTAHILLPADVSLFLKSGAAINDEKNNRFKKLLEDKVWNNIMALSKQKFAGESICFFRDLPHNIEKSEEAWEKYIKCNDPENMPVPDYEDRITHEKDIGDFIKLCLIRGLREDRSVLASMNYINSKLGAEYVKPQTKSLEEIHMESAHNLPILFLLSAGANPTGSLDDFAKKKRKPIAKISMGEEQDKKAMEAMKAAFATGDWVLLENCHLGLDFMAKIEDILNPKNVHIEKEFRLWLTCEPHDNFPLGLLQMSVKVTDEPPKGVKAGLYRTFSTLITEEFLEKEDPPEKWKSIVYTLCYQHSIIQERRKFGAIGFCIPYEFNDSDLQASLKFLDNHNSKISQSTGSSGNINWDTVKYMVSEVQYGGRITDDQDRETFKRIANEFLVQDIIMNEYEYKVQGSNFKYVIPSSNKISDILSYIMKMPEKDSPELFGLHPIADLTFRLKESKELLATLIDTQPKESGGGEGKTMEECVKDMLLNELIHKLPKDYVEVEYKQLISRMKGPKFMTDKRGLEVPLCVVLSQEIQRFQKILALVREMMGNIVQAIDGQIMMTPEIVNAINSIFDVRVPEKWLHDIAGNEISWLTPTLSLWMNGLEYRNRQLNDWLRIESGRPSAYWLTGFFNPQGFLTAMKQEVTRQNKASNFSLDSMVYDFEPQKNIMDVDSLDKQHTALKQRDEGLYIYGLFLEGAVFDEKEKKLKEYGLDAKSCFNPFQVIYCTAKQSQATEAQGHRFAGKDQGDANIYECPLYKYKTRTDRYLICKVNLNGGNIKDPKSHWTRRGVSLLCSTD